jgi:hypothetical protein
MSERGRYLFSQKLVKERFTHEAHLLALSHGRRRGFRLLQHKRRRPPGAAR